MKQILFAFIFGVWEYWLGKTKIIVANSTLELFEWLGKRLIERVKLSWKKKSESAQ